MNTQTGRIQQSEMPRLSRPSENHGWEVASTAAGVILAGGGTYELAKFWVNNNNADTVQRLGFAGAGFLGAAWVLNYGMQAFSDRRVIGRLSPGYEPRTKRIMAGAAAASLVVGAAGLNAGLDNDGNNVSNPNSAVAVNIPEDTVDAPVVVTTTPIAGSEAVASVIADGGLGGECSIFAPFPSSSTLDEAGKAKAGLDAVKLKTWLNSHTDEVNGLPYFTGNLKDQTIGEDVGDAVDLLQADKKLDTAQRWNELACQATGPVSGGGLWNPS